MMEGKDNQPRGEKRGTDGGKIMREKRENWEFQGHGTIGETCEDGLDWV